LPAPTISSRGGIKQIESLADGDVIVKLSNQSGPTALDALRMYGEHVLPKLRS